MTKSFVRAALVTALAVGASFAQAQVVNLTGWTFGSGNTVSVTAPADNGPAGGFTGSLVGFGGFDTPSFQTYCVELTQSFNLPSGNMTDYSIIAGSADTAWGANAVTIAANLGKLITYVNSTGAVTTAAQSTSLQLAIWNTIYDTDSTLLSGAFYETSGATSPYVAYADSLLAGGAATTSNLAVFVLKSSSAQDFLVTTPVPEPSTYALMLAGLAGIGFVARRRSQQN